MHINIYKLFSILFRFYFYFTPLPIFKILNIIILSDDDIWKLYM